MTEEFFARGFLYRGWSESFLGSTGAIVLSSLVWTALHLQYDWFFLGEVFSIGLLLGYIRYRSHSTWLTMVCTASTISPRRCRPSGWRDELKRSRHQRDRDRHRDRRQNRLQRDDLRQQRRVAAHLAGQHIGTG